MDEVEAHIAARVRDSLSAADVETARLLLHPYLHWTSPDGSVVRGRVNVLAVLAVDGVPDEFAAIELRDGQIYRWVCEPLAE